MYRSSDPKKYRAQTRYMIANDILISNRGDRLSTKPFTYTKAKDINYETTESQRRFKAARFLSIGWLPAVRAWKGRGGQKIKTEALKPNTSKYGSIYFEGSGPHFSVIIQNKIPAFGSVEAKRGIIGRALANVAADIRDYLNKQFSVRKNRYIQGSPVSA